MFIGKVLRVITKKLSRNSIDGSKKSYFALLSSALSSIVPSKIMMSYRVRNPRIFTGVAAIAGYDSIIALSPCNLFARSCPRSILSDISVFKYSNLTSFLCYVHVFVSLPSPLEKVRNRIFCLCILMIINGRLL